MKKHFSLFNCAACYVFPLIVLFCSSAHASLLRYDVVFDEEHLGHMVFDAQLGASSQNLWGSLMDWALNWDGVFLNRSNSIANPDSRFFIDALGNVTDDGREEIACTTPPGFPICAPTISVIDNPAFEGSDGSRIDFIDSSFVGGLLNVGYANGVSNLQFGKLVYSGPSAVPLPATIWLITIALLWFGVTQWRKVFCRNTLAARTDVHFL